jgi:hypothetical protein
VGDFCDRERWISVHALVLYRFSNANVDCESGNNGDGDVRYDLYGNFHGYLGVHGICGGVSDGRRIGLCYR